jgi:hypothetical protein
MNKIGIVMQKSLDAQKLRPTKVVRCISYKIIIFMIRSTIATDAKKARGCTIYTYITASIHILNGLPIVKFYVHSWWDCA